MDRRTLLQAGGGVGVLGLLAAAGVISPELALAANGRAGFDARELDAALAALGAQDAEAGAALSLSAPDIAEVASAVSIEVVSRVPGTDRIAILVAKNPFPLAAVFSFPEGTQPEVSTRLKMAESAEVIALARAGGRFYMAKKAVSVTIGGCG
ncbi:MAG: thiosulfate oxidation carrier protein SoxY [Thauera sp.]